MALRLKGRLARIFKPQRMREPAEEPPRERRLGTRKPAFQTVLVEWEDLDKGTQAFAGRLENRSPNGLGIRGPRPVPRGKAILVSTEDEPTVKAIVRHCISGDEGFYLGAQVILRDKRRSDREPMNCAAEISCTRGGQRSDLPVVIRDASELGLQLESPEALPLEEVIEISHLGSYRLGSVTHCRRDDECYRIGVQFIGPALPAAHGEIN